MFKVTKRQKSKGATIAQKRGAIVGQDELTRTLINLPNPPVVLSSWLGANPRNFVQIESLEKEKGKGFNEIAWRDKGGSKLYLENLDSEGAIKEELKVTYTQVQSLANASHWENPLPDTIVVKSAGGPLVRMAAKQMVLELLDSYQNDPELQKQRGFKLPHKPILKETPTDNPGDKFAIEFSVEGITQIEPIMSLRTVVQYSQLFSDTLLGALKTYQVNLTAGVVDGFRVEEVAATPNRKMFQAIDTAAQDLLSALDKEIAEKKKIAKVTGGPGLATLKESLATLETLQTQVESAIKDGFRNELDTRRWQQWLTDKPVKEQPLTEDVIVPGTETQIGAGVQGAVFKYELDPALKIKPVVLKYDSNGLNDDATNAGIPEVNPQQSVRAVAAFKISNLLELGVIPRTEVFVGTDAEGRPKLGQAMEFVNGAMGQRAAGKKNAYVDQNFVQSQENILNNPRKFPDELASAKAVMPKYVKVHGTWYEAQIFPVDITYNDPVVQQGLSDLQVFDYIIGHADRNAGNWIYEKQGDTIIGVKGIDNDDTFGAKWLPTNPDAKWASEKGSKTPGIPPIVDISTALNILKTDFEAIRPLLAGLSDQEIAKAAERFDQVQQQVRQRVMAGKIASKGDVDPAELQQLRNKVPDMGPNILRWGNQTAGDHTDQNSYLGLQLAQKNWLAQQYPDTGGVLPQRGDVGLV